MNNLVIDTIMNRRSIRNYKEDQLTEDELQTILAAGIHAPSANNCQSWHFTVIQDKSFIKYMNEKSKDVMLNSVDKNIAKMGKSDISLFYNAPTLVIVSGKEEVESSLVDCSAAIENMLIAANSIGVGSVWIGMIRFFLTLADEVKQLKIPNGYTPFYAVSLGHKKDNYIITPSKRNKDVINYIR